MGNYSILLQFYIDIFYSNNDKENLLYKRINNVFKTNKNLDLSTEFTCSKESILYLSIKKNYYNILKIILDYDEELVNYDVLRFALRNDCKYTLFLILKIYKKKVSINKYYNDLKNLLNKSLAWNYPNNYIILIKEMYKLEKLNKTISSSFCSIKYFLDMFKNKKTYFIKSNTVKHLLKYDSFLFKFKRTNNYPSVINEYLNIIYKLNLPNEIIDIICDYFLFIIDYSKLFIK